MINRDCEILQKGKGFCWCPGAAWEIKGSELCCLCREKNQKQETNMIGSSKTSQSFRPASTRIIGAAA